MSEKENASLIILRYNHNFLKLIHFICVPFSMMRELEKYFREFHAQISPREIV